MLICKMPFYNLVAKVLLFFDMRKFLTHKITIYAKKKLRFAAKCRFGVLGV